MTISELVAAVMEQAEEVNNVPMDDTEKLARKIASTADSAGIVAAAVDLHADIFTDEERGLATAAVIERAERFMQAQAERSRAKVRKINEAKRLPILPKREDGYYLDASEETPDRPEWGPYDTKKQAEEERSSYLKNHKLPTEKELAKAEAKEKARRSGTGATKASEPKSAKSVTPSTEGNESEESVKTDHPKKKGGKPAKAKGAGNGSKAKADKPAKPVKAKKAAKEPGEKKMSALDAAFEVLKNRTVPMSARELIAVMAERKLWVSAKGATPDATLAAALVREINGKGRESRFTKPEAGRFAAK